jgi:hypothetical protein
VVASVGSKPTRLSIRSIKLPGDSLLNRSFVIAVVVLVVVWSNIVEVILAIVVLTASVVEFATTAVVVLVAVGRNILAIVVLTASVVEFASIVEFL